MVLKRYKRGKYVGEDVFCDYGILQNGKKYKGEFVVFPETKYGLGCVLFSVCSDKVVARSEQWDWEFSKSDMIQ